MKIALSGEPQICAALTAGLRGQGCDLTGAGRPDLLVWCAPEAPAQVVSAALSEEQQGRWSDYAVACGEPVGDNSGENRAQGSLLLLCDREAVDSSAVLVGQLPGLTLRFAPRLRVNLLIGNYAAPSDFLRPAFHWLARSPVVTGQILGSVRL